MGGGQAEIEVLSKVAMLQICSLFLQNMGRGDLIDPPPPLCIEMGFYADISWESRMMQPKVGKGCLKLSFFL